MLMSSLVNQTRCPVCEMELDTESLVYTIVLRTPRGSQGWRRCPGCRSFFAAERYDLEEEVEHTRTRPWGAVESGMVLNEDKGPMFDTVLRVLRDYAPKGSTLLDIGCSYGGFLKRAQKEGYEVRGMDIVPEAVEYVRSQGSTCDCAGSAGDLDIPDNSQGVISVLDCNYYWPSQRKELRAIYSRLCLDGLLVMRVVDTSWAIQLGLWLRRFFPGAGQRLCEKAVYDHRVSVPVRSLLRIVQQEGFEIIYTSPRDAMPFRHNSYKVTTAYAIGQFAWRIFGYNLSPGFIFVARKRAP
jgi:SAM-dependent methyltransferase